MDSPTSPIDCEGDARKRVCKACDRCRIKKSKCDGKKPCGRCRNDDAICVFGGRKRTKDRVFPKGYVEVLERQQKQLVRGIRALYDAQIAHRPWTGPLTVNGYPPTHEILEHLGVLEIEDSSEDEDFEDEPHFEENVQQLRHSILKKGDPAHSIRPDSTYSSLIAQHTLLQNQHPRDYFGKTQLASTRDTSSTPSLSPDSLNTARTSLSTSLETKHWPPHTLSSPASQRCPDALDKIFVSGDGASLSYESDLDGNLMQDTFGSSYLTAPWESGEDGFPYPA